MFKYCIFKNRKCVIAIKTDKFAWSFCHIINFINATAMITNWFVIVSNFNKVFNAI